MRPGSRAGGDRPGGADARAPGAQAPLVCWDLVDESGDEAEFLWRQREAALEAHDRTPDEVETAIEGRLLGAIEGLCVPGAAAVERVLAPALQSDDPARVALAAHALLVGDTPEGSACFRAAFLRGAGDRLQPDPWQALRHGLELVETAAPLVGLASSARDASDGVRAAFLDACSFRALPLEPRLGDLLTAGVGPELQRAAAHLLRHASRAVVEAWLPRALDLMDRRGQEAAVTTGLIAGVPGAWGACRALALAEIHDSAEMLLPLAISGARRDHDVVINALDRPARRRAALWALGFGGRRAGADACVDVLAQGRNDRHTRLAAEAFCAITGLDMRAAGLVVAAAATATATAAGAPASADPLPAFEDDDLDADLVPSADERLPAPDVPEVIRWWNRNRARFDADTRYLGGQPARVSLLVAALANGPMRRRHALAFELAVRTRGRFQLETRGFLAEQRRRLAAFAVQSGGAPSVDAVDAIEGPLSQETSSRAGR